MVVRNRPNRAAPYLLIGRDDQGQCLTMPIVPTEDSLTWRVITGWYCKPSEAAILRKRRSIMEQPVRYPSPQDRFDEDDLEDMSLDNWDWANPIEGRTIGDLKAIFSLSFTFEELDTLVEAAHAQGLETEAFIKRLVLEGLRATRT